MKKTSNEKASLSNNSAAVKNVNVSALLGLDNGEAEADDAVLDPNNISKTSEGFKEIFEENDDETTVPIKTFEQRLAARKTSFRLVSGSDEEEGYVDGVRTLITEKFPPAAARAVLNSPCGLKALLHIDSPEALMGYCSILSLTTKDIDQLIQTMRQPYGSFAAMSSVMAVGIFAENERQKTAKGVESSKAAKFVAEYAFKHLHGSSTFFEGVALAKRVWNNVQTEKKRGRRVKSLTARYFMAEEAEATTKEGDKNKTDELA
jgi:hypothetical protein